MTHPRPSRVRALLLLAAAATAAGGSPAGANADRPADTTLQFQTNQHGKSWGIADKEWKHATELDLECTSYKDHDWSEVKESLWLYFRNRDAKLSGPSTSKTSAGRLALAADAAHRREKAEQRAAGHGHAEETDPETLQVPLAEEVEQQLVASLLQQAKRKTNSDCYIGVFCLGLFAISYMEPHVRSVVAMQAQHFLSVKYQDAIPLTYWDTLASGWPVFTILEFAGVQLQNDAAAGEVPDYVVRRIFEADLHQRLGPVVEGLKVGAGVGVAAGSSSSPSGDTGDNPFEFDEERQRGWTPLVADILYEDANDRRGSLFSPATDVIGVRRAGENPNTKNGISSSAVEQLLQFASADPSSSSAKGGQRQHQAPLRLRPLTPTEADFVAEEQGGLTQVMDAVLAHGTETLKKETNGEIQISVSDLEALVDFEHREERERAETSLLHQTGQDAIQTRLNLLQGVHALKTATIVVLQQQAMVESLRGSVRLERILREPHEAVRERNFVVQEGQSESATKSLRVVHEGQITASYLHWLVSNSAPPGPQYDQIHGSTNFIMKLAVLHGRDPRGVSEVLLGKSSQGADTQTVDAVTDAASPVRVALQILLGGAEGRGGGGAAGGTDKLRFSSRPFDQFARATAYFLLTEHVLGQMENCCEDAGGDALMAQISSQMGEKLKINVPRAMKTSAGNARHTSGNWTAAAAHSTSTQHPLFASPSELFSENSHGPNGVGSARYRALSMMARNLMLLGEMEIDWRVHTERQTLFSTLYEQALVSTELWPFFSVLRRIENYGRSFIVRHDKKILPESRVTLARAFNGAKVRGFREGNRLVPVQPVSAALPGLSGGGASDGHHDQLLASEIGWGCGGWMACRFARQADAALGVGDDASAASLARADAAGVTSLHHVAISGDSEQLEGVVATLNSLVRNSREPERVVVHYFITESELPRVVGALCCSFRIDTSDVAWTTGANGSRSPPDAAQSSVEILLRSRGKGEDEDVAYADSFFARDDAAQTAAGGSGPGIRRRIRAPDGTRVSGHEEYLVVDVGTKAMECLRSERGRRRLARHATFLLDGKLRVQFHLFDPEFRDLPAAAAGNEGAGGPQPHLTAAQNATIPFVTPFTEAEIAKKGNLTAPHNYVRFSLAQRLADSVKAVFYIDVDVVVRGDVGELMTEFFHWKGGETPPHEAELFPIATVPRANPISTFIHVWDRERMCRWVPAFSTPSFNAGVMLLNLYLWRKEGWDTRVREFFEEFGEGQSGGGYEMMLPPPSGSDVASTPGQQQVQSGSSSEMKTKTKKKKRPWIHGSQPPLLLLFGGGSAGPRGSFDRILHLPDSWNVVGLGHDCHSSLFDRGACQAKMDEQIGRAKLLHWTGPRKPWYIEGQVSTDLYGASLDAQTQTQSGDTGGWTRDTMYHRHLWREYSRHCWDAEKQALHVAGSDGIV